VCELPSSLLKHLLFRLERASRFALVRESVAAAANGDPPVKAQALGPSRSSRCSDDLDRVSQFVRYGRDQTIVVRVRIHFDADVSLVSSSLNGNEARTNRSACAESRLHDGNYVRFLKRFDQGAKRHRPPIPLADQIHDESLHRTDVAVKGEQMMGRVFIVQR
jgi:hypothetical protein